MEQLPAEPSTPSRGLSPRMKAFIAFDAVLLLAFVVVLGLFLSGAIGGSGEPDADATEDPRPLAGATAAPESPAAAEPSTDAGSTFALPSGNIACEITADAATCTIANTTAPAAEAPDCAGSVGPVLTVTAEGADTPCVEGALPGAAAPGTPVLEYGQSMTVGEFTCTSSSTGVTCKHDPTGKGFKLAKAGSELF
ncbi:hypothetical protein [Pengzhenrongella sicca]|uniref:Uncharacterized protein n=1 Tax=Pengzhenrongella sicca TaxID=2819238 RepID=A0A8A4ZGE1_9MICO|nr:hypothetical protein [Pengzhenrongella sicca]QTE30451.1 hypothetical protein J4E96_05555 [Pengzhenrongella sicca]